MQGFSGGMSPQGKGAGSHPVFEASLRTQEAGPRGAGCGSMLQNTWWGGKPHSTTSSHAGMLQK
jgi:hypothetical protein